MKRLAKAQAKSGLLPRIDVERAGEFPQRPGRLVRLGEPPVVQRDREEQDEEPADRARDQEHGELVAGEQLDQERAAHRRDGQTDAQDARDQAALSGRDLVRSTATMAASRALKNSWAMHHPTRTTGRWAPARR